ncbi:hypothetical protein uav_061 [Pseudomonas phage UAVern]|uniref:Uncharacterized protein n=1 Tax=Pseudomonas phage UAVern TaxID=2856997 RepID=A0A975UWB3_9CAUD|nr:hypothetical protein uav_061 [Pseudomonas phage UAVern]
MTGFTFVTTTTTQTEGGNRPAVKWDELNAHVVAAAGGGKVRSIPGIISGLIDLGEQNLEDAAIPVTDEKFRKKFPKYDGSEAQKAVVVAEYAKKENVRFETIDGVENLRYVQNPVQQLAVMVDFPQCPTDKGQFFGNSNPLPLRLPLNGEFTLPGEKVKVVGKPYNIKEMKHDIGGGKSVWAFAKNNGIHKLADAVGLLDANGLFTKNRIGELLGKVAQFQFQVYMKPGKSGGEFFTETIKLVGMVPEGVPVPEVPEGILHGVNLYAENDPEAVKQLRVAIKNTIKRANNYAGSPLSALLEANASQTAPQAAPKEKVEGIAPAPKAPDEDFDDDVPF